jgi:type I restriction enzyme M protein
VKAACQALDPAKCYRNRDEFSEDLEIELHEQGIKPRAPLIKAILNAFSERDEDADTYTDAKGRPEPDTDLRDYENVPLSESVEDYFEREVRPHVPDAWIDESKRDPHDGEVGIVGYEIPFNREFYKFVPPRPLEEIDADLKECTDRIKQMIEELSA